MIASEEASTAFTAPAASEKAQEASMMPMCATMGSRPLLAIAVAEEEEEEEGEGEGGEGEDNATVASVSAVVEEEEEEEEELTQPSHNNSKSDLSNFGKCFWGQS